MTTTWHNEAACKGKPMEWFFPVHGGKAARHAAAGIGCCNRCPVREECLEEALAIEAPRMLVKAGRAHGMPEGIFGGLLPKERVLLVMERRYSQAS